MWEGGGVLLAHIIVNLSEPQEGCGDDKGDCKEFLVSQFWTFFFNYKPQKDIPGVFIHGRIDKPHLITQI